VGREELAAPQRRLVIEDQVDGIASMADVPDVLEERSLWDYSKFV
jgi:hypothetical protein